MSTIILYWHCLFYCILLYWFKLLDSGKTATMKLQSFNQKQFDKWSKYEVSYTTDSFSYSRLSLMELLK